MQANKPILRSNEYRWQTDPDNPKRLVRGAVLNNLKDFLTLKRSNPRSAYGASDKPFATKSTLGLTVPGLAHAHLNADLSIVYRIEGNILYLYGIYSHEQLGTGQPAKINVQKSMAQKFNNMNFSE